MNELEIGLKEFDERFGSTLWADRRGAEEEAKELIASIVEKVLSEKMKKLKHFLETERWKFHSMGDDTRTMIPVDEVNALCKESHNVAVDAIWDFIEK